MQTFIHRLSRAVSLTGLLLATITAAAADARDDIFRAYQKMMSSRFTVDMTTVSGGDASKAHGDYETVERIHLKREGMEIIVVPEGTWMRSGSDWIQSPIDMSGMVKEIIPKSIDEMRAAIQNATDAGMTTWDGQPVHSYTYDVDTAIMGIHATSKYKIFVGAVGQIVHVESDGEAMGRISLTKQDIRYDDSIRVTAPN